MTMPTCASSSSATSPSPAGPRSGSTSSPEIGRRPWLGHGFGSFWDTGAAINPIRSAPPGAWFMKAQLINTAHNGYLDLLLQTGIVGFALGIVAILRCLWLLTGTAARSPKGPSGWR